MNAYVSRELTHFVGRGRKPDDQYNLLVTILRGGSLIPPPQKPGKADGGNLRVSTRKRISSNQLYQPNVVCFCDIPVPLRRIHMNKYSEFGISFTKRFLVSKGASPVFYVASTSLVAHLNGRKVPRNKYFDETVSSYQTLVREFERSVSRGDETVLQIANSCLYLQHLLDFHVLPLSSSSIPTLRRMIARTSTWNASGGFTVR